MSVVLNNVRVFDGFGLETPITVTIDGARIGDTTGSGKVIDAGGAVLLPGFIDAHVHVDGRLTLDLLAAHGVTTALDMAAAPDKVAELRGLAGTTDIRSAVTPIIGPGGPHAQFLGQRAILDDPADAEAAVAERIAEGSDYLELVLEPPGAGGPDIDTVHAAVTTAHARQLRVIAHATTAESYAMALDAHSDVITHVPLGTPLPPELIDRLATAGTVVVPTLTMMQRLAIASGRPDGIEAGLASVGAMHAAGIPILAGTDANSTPGLPFPTYHGTDLHHELELLVRAGLSPTEALTAATILPARYFDLPDRGMVAPGMRADLVLVDGDPTADIRATRNITHIWCAGIEHPPAHNPACANSATRVSDTATG
ncbi:amidohydrolase family protein [Nocardia brasiliensis]